MARVVVITGGSRGFGKALARAWIALGDTVVISARNAPELAAVAKEIGAHAFPADVTDEAAVEALAQFVKKEFGRIDIWVNNAGVWLPHERVEEFAMSRVRAMFDVNVIGVMHGTRSALRVMRPQKSGIIVNISSTSGLSPRPTSSTYAATKWAVRGFSESVRAEVQDEGIRVITVFPGGMQTDLFNEAKPADFNAFMSPDVVAAQVVANAGRAEPENDLIIKRN